MTSSNSLKKLVSIGAAMLLAVGGSLVAAEPAFAVTPTAVPVLSSGAGVDIKTTTVTVSSAAIFTGVTAETDRNYWLVCGTYSLPYPNDWSATNGRTTFTEIASGNCKIALSGNTLADAITGTTLTFSDVTHLWNSNTSASTATTAGSLVDKWIVRYESKVTGSTVDAWAASSPGTLRAAVTTNPGVSGTASPSGSITLSSSVVWSTVPSSTSYYLLQCDARRTSGTEKGEVIIANLQQDFTLGCAPWSVAGTPVAYTQLPISLPAGLSTGKYLAILIAQNRTNYVTSSLSSAYSNSVASSITGTPSITRNQSTFIPTTASTTGNDVYIGWAACDTARATAANGTGSNAITALNATTNDCVKIYSAQSHSLYNSNMLVSSTTAYENPSGQTLDISGKNIVFYQEYSSGAQGYAYSASSTFATVGGGNQVVNNVVSRVVTPVAESAKPLPTWAAPILKQIPTLSKTLTTDGGKLSLTDGDFSSLKSVTIGGAPVAFSIDAKGDVNIPVPAGKGGTTADLIVTFTGGKMTIQDGIKYVEPVNVAAVREAPIAGFKGKSTKITGALAGSIQYAAQLDKKATTVLCTGYAASKAELATATARAEAACAYATKVNDLLVNKTVKVVVNAKLAKTAAVGIKVHK